MEGSLRSIMPQVIVSCGVRLMADPVGVFLLSGGIDCALRKYVNGSGAVHAVFEMFCIRDTDV